MLHRGAAPHAANARCAAPARPARKGQRGGAHLVGRREFHARPNGHESREGEKSGLFHKMGD
jgi:hypothetical protein